jgi:hypothetical protein
MPPGDYERYRKRLEQQLRADVGLLVEAYRAKLRAYETVARTRGELEVAGPWPEVEVSNLLPAAGSGPAEPPGLALAPAPAPGEGGPITAPAAAAPAPRPEPKKRRSPFELSDAVEAALVQVGEEFDRRELCRALGFEPSRATLYRILQELEHEGRIAVVEHGTGTIGNRYRKLTPAAAEGS